MKTLIILTVLVMTMSGCANQKRNPPSQETIEYLERTGLTNEPAVMYDAMETKIFTLGIYNDTSEIPFNNGTVYKKNIHTDTTGYKEVFKWALDTAADGAKTAWGGLH